MLQGHFIDYSTERLFCVAHRADAPAPEQPAVLVVPALWDEMNRSRRMIAECARRLNRSGIALFVPDLSGTGDSTGEAAEASWDDWLHQLQTIRKWIQACGFRVDGLIAVRAGALLAAASTFDHPMSQSIFWQPIQRGQTAVRQLVRVRVAASALRGDKRESATELTDRLLGGETVLAAGYPLCRDLVAPLNQAVLPDLIHAGLGRLRSMEIASNLPAPEHSAEQWGAHTVEISRFPGQPFWNPGDIVANAAVIEATARSFAEGAASELPA